MTSLSTATIAILAVMLRIFVLFFSVHMRHAHGLRFNLDKCKFRCTGLPFFGHIIGAEGLQPDPRKIGSILSMSSPLHPQSNGLSERTVQTVKDLLHKCKESGQDPHLAMLCLRGTPLGHDLPSPAELLNGRVYQTNRKNRRHLRATGEHGTT